MNKKIRISFWLVLALVMTFIYACVDEQSSLTKDYTSTFVETRGEGLCESPLPVGCVATFADITYIIPEGTIDYPNCEFWVDLKVRKCGSQIDIIYVGFGAPNPLDTDCDQFEIDATNPLIAAQVLEDVQRDLIRAASIRASLPSPGNPLSTLPICGVDPVIVVNLFQSACSKFCLSVDKEFNYKITPLPCGNSCCKSTNEICFDLATGLVKVTETSSTIPASPCELNSNFPCLRSSIWESSCSPRCASIGTGG